MVCHQHRGMHGAGRDGGRGRQPGPIHTIIFLVQEDRLTMMPTREDMLGHVVQRVARKSRHSFNAMLIFPMFVGPLRANIQAIDQRSRGSVWVPSAPGTRQRPWERLLLEPDPLAQNTLLHRSKTPL